MTFTPTQGQLDFYREVYTLQHRNRKHFRWTYAMFASKFGEIPSAEIKKQKKVVEVKQETIDYVNQAYKLWYDNRPDVYSSYMFKEVK